MAENIVIPSQIYIGYTQRSVDEKLGFGTYFEDNAACRKRQATIDSWIDKKIPTEVIDNKPRAGYHLSERVTHGGGWNDLNVFWRIVDPRGFELEISSGNLGKLFQYCDIDHGLITGECVWGWDKGNGSKVVLLPVNSEIYVQSEVSTDRHNAKSISLKDLKIGDWVHLKNDQKGTYFGKITYGWYSSDLKIGPGKVTFSTSYVIQNEDDTLYFIQSPKVIATAEGKIAYTKESAEKHLDARLDYLISSSSRFSGINIAGTDRSPYDAVFITYDLPSLCTTKFVEKQYTLTEFATYLRSLTTSKEHNRQALANLTYYCDPIIMTSPLGTRYYAVGAVSANYSADVRRYRENISDFSKGVSDNLSLNVRELSVGEIDSNVGLQIERNTHFPDSHWASRSRYNTDEFLKTILDITSCDKFATLKVQFKDCTRSIHRGTY
jgi:hypothetical protein